MIDEWFLREFQELALRGPRRAAIDVGANLGEWSRWMALHFEQVISAEPDPRARRLFYAAGAPRQCALLPIACGRESGVFSLHMREQSAQSSLLESHPVEAGAAVQSIPVTVATLDQVAALCQHTVIDFVKIDVEGAEADVLAGISSQAFRRARLLIEMHDRDTEVGLELQRLGYSDIRIRQNPYASAHENHKWIFVPPLEPAE